MKVGVQILPREVILDTQGRAVEHVLQEQKLKVNQCRVGKYIELDVPFENFDQAEAEVKKMLDFVLYNPLIETYKILRLS